MLDYGYQDIAKMIDHSLLAPSTTLAELEAGCRLAIEYQVASVCIMPHYLERASALLRGSGVLSTTTIGFPHGTETTSVKLVEAEQALDDGAEELDVVVNVSRVRSGDFAYVHQEVRELTGLAHERGQKIKLIFENCYLDRAQKLQLCRLCGELGVDFAKTSTGFGSAGATVEDVRLMREYCPPSVAVKAAGGVKDLDFMLAVRAAGATRSGCSRTREVLEELKRRLDLREPFALGPSAGIGG